MVRGVAQLLVYDLRASAMTTRFFSPPGARPGPKFPCCCMVPVLPLSPFFVCALARKHVARPLQSERNGKGVTTGKVHLFSQRLGVAPHQIALMMGTPDWAPYKKYHQVAEKNDGAFSFFRFLCTKSSPPSRKKTPPLTLYSGVRCVYV